MSKDPRAFASEKAFQTAVVRAARTQGVLAYHTFDSRRSEPGYPDLTLVGRSDVLFRELKTDDGDLGPDQEKWLRALRAAGMNAAIWRPRNWPEPIMSELRALGRAQVPEGRPSQAELRRHLQRGRDLAAPVDPTKS